RRTRQARANPAQGAEPIGDRRRNSCCGRRAGDTRGARPAFAFLRPLRLSLRLVRTRRLTRELRRLACAPKESCSLRRRGGAVVVLFRNDAFGRGVTTIFTQKNSKHT